MATQMELGFSMGSDNQNIEIADYLIVGGGVGGLATANRFVDCGIAPVVVDAGQYPSHKICGEFFSFESHPILEEWGVLPSSVIKKIQFHAGPSTYEFLLPRPAIGGSRYIFDHALCNRAVAKGAKVITGTSVTKIDYNPKDEYRYEITLDNGRRFLAKTLFIGIGRLLNLLIKKDPPKMRYVGMKAHVKGIHLDHTLEMHLAPGGYFGVSPIDNNLVNVACLAKLEAVNRAGSPKEYLRDVFKNSMVETFVDNSSVDWMVTKVPEFSSSRNPRHDFRNLYLVGDAAGSIAPASGDGLAMAVTAGVLAADCAIRADDTVYQEAWCEIYSNRLTWAKRLHWLMLHPRVGKIALKSCSLYPELFDYFFRKTRGVHP